VYVPLNATTAARAAVVLRAAGPWWLIELGLLDFPDACVATQEGESHRAADWQQFGRPYDRHAEWPARL